MAAVRNLGVVATKVLLDVGF